MPVLDTKNFGQIPFREESVLHFPAGLPGFEERRGFLPIQMPESEPLIFLQSIEDAGLCFVTLPVPAIDSGYRLEVGDEDLERLGFPASHRPRPGVDVLCLAVIAIRPDGPTANLLAPIVVNLANQRGVQAIAQGSDYSVEHALLPVEAPACS